MNMSKKKSMLFLSFPKFSWMSAFIIGAIIGIASQRITEVRAYTDTAIQSAEHSFSYSYTEAGSLPGQPISTFQIHHPGYSLAYDARNRNPAWVYEHLTAESIKGNAERSIEFKEDEHLSHYVQL